jgi:3-hydroxybutyrate dehydrogenase
MGFCDAEIYIAPQQEQGHPAADFECGTCKENRMLKGKSALVTGSTSGIGQAIAHALAKAGANVMLNGFGDAGAIEKQRAALAKECSVTVAYSAADMTKPAEIADMVKTAEKAFGALDILVNNAGIQHVAPVENFPIDRWDAVIAINLSSSFHTIRAALPGMKKRKWGRIINIASAHGLVASAEKAAYVAAKHGLMGLTKVVAIEAANDGVTCNAICPGWVLTPLVQKQIDDRAKASGQTNEQAKIALISEKQPMHEFTKPDSIGALAVFLCGDAAETITGVAHSIDGGWIAQ